MEEIVQAIDRNFTVEKLLQNLQLMDTSGQLTLSGLLLLGKSIQRYRPVFTIKCVSFVGNTEASKQFRDKMRDRDAEGNLLIQYNASISFVTRNLKTVQVEKEFNTQGQLEIPLEVFVELLTNAFVHRDYYINSPIRLFIFDNRIEIHSPGILPDGVTEESIKHGISVPRNKLLFENAKDILPYTGIGSGILRAMQSYDKISFKNDFVREEFITILKRDEILEELVVDTANFGVNENTPKKDMGDFGVNENTPKSDIGHFGVNETQKHILKFISENPQITAGEIAYKMKQTKRNIEYNIKALKAKGIIERFGSDKTGSYKINQ
jgi:predicted HTH transcriptional regulator